MTSIITIASKNYPDFIDVKCPGVCMYVCVIIYVHTRFYMHRIFLEIWEKIVIMNVSKKGIRYFRDKEVKGN